MEYQYWWKLISVKKDNIYFCLHKQYLLLSISYLQEKNMWSILDSSVYSSNKAAYFFHLMLIYGLFSPNIKWNKSYWN